MVIFVILHPIKDLVRILSKKLRIPPIGFAFIHKKS